YRVGTRKAKQPTGFGVPVGFGVAAVVGACPGFGDAGGAHLALLPPSSMGPSRLPKVMSASFRYGVIGLRISRPSFGGRKLSLIDVEPSITSPTAAIVIISLLAGV